MGHIKRFLNNKLTRIITRIDNDKTLNKLTDRLSN